MSDTAQDTPDESEATIKRKKCVCGDCKSKRRCRDKSKHKDKEPPPVEDT